MLSRICILLLTLFISQQMAFPAISSEFVATNKGGNALSTYRRTGAGEIYAGCRVGLFENLEA